MATPYDATIEDLQNAIIAAEQNYQIWWVFRGSETRPRYLDVMNSYLGYFRVAISAHFIAMVMPLYRIYEVRSDTHNLPNLIKRLEDDGAISKSAIDSLRSEYLKIKPLWTKVSILRNEVFGHRSIELGVDEVFAKAGVSGDELKELITRTKVLLNNLNHVVRDTMHAFNLSATADTIRLLEDLKNTQ